jgi:DNA-3-methyladenine glycosylase I
MKKFEIRQATLDDCSFVARCIAMALHIDLQEEWLHGFASICAREDVLYSYRHALIAWEENKPLGLCLAYDGNNYHEIRLKTFALFAALDDEPDDDMDLEHAEDETKAGEYYIDSLAVLPEYRRQGIARQLMQAQIEKGRQLGFTHFTLLVDPTNPNAQKLYSQFGFKYESDCYAFGQNYWKWGLKM